MRKNEYKPLLFTTTIRNPERYKILLNILLAFDGHILTNEVIDKIIFEFVARKLYVPLYVTRTPHLKEHLLSDDRFSDKDTAEIIANSPQDHKEAGFDKGWASRFDTFYKFAMELGFVYYEMNNPIELSETGLKLIKSSEPEFSSLEQQVFLNAFVKYQRDNPFRRVKNSNKPLVLLLQTISELKKIYGEDCAGISRLEIPLVLCWKNGDAVTLAKLIKEIRDKYSFTPSSEIIYAECKQVLELSAKDEKRFKLSNITRELPDEFIRKMRLPWLISLRGNGRFIDFNTLESKKIKYVLENYAVPSQKFKTTRDYYVYMKKINENLVSIEAKAVIAESDKEKYLMKWADSFELSELKDELKIVCNPKLSSRNAVLKFISEPVRLEFLTAVALKKAFPVLRVMPNYSVDDEGLPVSFAPGGGADIICCDERGNILFEVTLLTGTQQNIREMPAIARHLRDCVATITPDSFSVMLCPRAHSDTLEYAEFVRYKDKLDIAVWEIHAFVDMLGVYKNARNYRGK